MTESDDKSQDLGQALLDLQSQLEEVIQDFEHDTGEELSGEAEERRRVPIANVKESMKNDLDEIQNQVQLRMDQLEDRLSLLTKVMEEKPRTDSAAVNEDEPSKKTSAKDTVFGEISSSQKPSEQMTDKLRYCSFCRKSQHEVVKLLAGPSVFICNDCVELCNGILSEEESRSEKPTPESTAQSETDEADLNDSDDAPGIENSASGLLRKVKKLFAPFENRRQAGWSDESPTPKQQGQKISGQMRFWVFVGFCCLGLLLGAASTVVMLYEYPDIWVIGLPRILFSTVIALILLMAVTQRVRSDLPILVTLSVAALIGWYVTMLYLTSFSEFQFLRPVISENSDLTNFLILGGLTCVGLSFISRKVFRVCSYLYAGLGAFIGFAIAGSV